MSVDRGLVSYEVARILVGEMLGRQPYFDICPLRRIEDVLGREMPKRDERFLYAMHCVGWEKITPEVRRTMEDILFAFIGTEPAPAPLPKPAWWLRALKRVFA